MSPETASGLVPAPSAELFRRRRTRLAWLVIGLGFLGFVVLCAGGGLGIAAYATRASEARSAVLERSHGGQLEIQQAGLREWRLYPSDVVSLTLQEGDAVRTGPDTDALITLYDGSTLHLYYASEVRLAVLRTSRFFAQTKSARIEQRRGVVNYSMADRAPYAALDMLVTTGDNGEQAQITLGDNTTARVNMVGTGRTSVPYSQVTVLRGTAIVAQGGNYVHPEPGKMVRAFAGGTLHSPEPAADELFTNGNLVLLTEDPVEILAGWKLTPAPGTAFDAPRAITHTEALLSDELHSVELTRAATQQGPLQIVMQQDLSSQQVGFYRTLTLTLQVKVVAQPPGTGPHVPYPLSVRLHYYDQEGHERTWKHGFYYETGTPGPPQGDPPGVPVHKGAWSDALAFDLKQLAPDIVRLGWFEVVGEGPEFSVWVSGLSLVGQ